MKKNIIYISALILILTSSCNNKDNYEISLDSQYEKSKSTLAETEKKHPEKFIKTQTQSKKNLLGQTVIKGIIYNNAKVMTFKDIDIRLYFYSKTGAKLEEDTETIYETIHAGGSKSFKSKYFAPRGTDSVSVTVTGAKY